MQATKSNTNSIPNISFLDRQFKQTLKSHKHVLDIYKSTIESITKLEGDLPIFLDTSVILRVYEISFIAREKIKQFLQTNRAKTVLTGQVQFEFIKNREKVINSFQEDVTEQLPKDFNNSVISKLSSFINTNKIRLEDYTEIQEKLASLQSSASELLKEIQEKVSDKKGTAKALLFEDDFLSTLNDMQLLDPLADDYIKFLKDQFMKLVPTYKGTSNESYSLMAFPGCAEKSEKDDPTGDFIIYHEMMKYADDKRTPVIFLTNDTTKGDWLRKDGQPHLHYIENFYLNTGQLIYILDAERLFKGLFETSFESLIEDKNEVPDVIDSYALERFINDVDCFKDFKPPNLGAVRILANELYENGIYSISVLNDKLKFAQHVVPEIFEFIPNVTKAGAIKLCLNLLHNDYNRKLWNPNSEAKIKKLIIHWKENFGFIF